MATSGLVIIRMGHTVVHFRRHWGNPESTGLLLLELLTDAPQYKERAHFHEGGYVIQLLSSVPSQLSQMGLKKLVNPIATEFIICTGDENENYTYAYEARAVVREQSKDSVVVDIKVDWEVRFAELDEYEDDAQSWRDDAQPIPLSEFPAFLKHRIQTADHLEHNPEYKQALHDNLDRILRGERASNDDDSDS